MILYEVRFYSGHNMVLRRNMGLCIVGGMGAMGGERMEELRGGF